MFWIHVNAWFSQGPPYYKSKVHKSQHSCKFNQILLLQWCWHWILYLNCRTQKELELWHLGQTQYFSFISRLGGLKLRRWNGSPKASKRTANTCIIGLTETWIRLNTGILMLLGNCRLILTYPRIVIVCIWIRSHLVQLEDSNHCFLDPIWKSSIKQEGMSCQVGEEYRDCALELSNWEDHFLPALQLLHQCPGPKTIWSNKS